MQLTPNTACNHDSLLARRKREIIPSYEDASKQFIKPYPQQALNGEEGLTGTDVAKNLNVKLSHFLQKVR